MKILFRKHNIRQFLFIWMMIVLFSPKGSSQDNFQQEANYTIHVTLDDRRHKLSAFQRVEYINNSSDTLMFLYFHLWPNAWSTNNTELASQLLRSQGRQRLFEDPQLRGYIDSLDFRVDGRHVQWNTKPDLSDICRIILNEPVAPGDTIYITTPFRVKIPDGRTSQLGHIGESYQMAHWYPKPAQRIDEILWLVEARQNLEQPLDMAVRDYNRVHDVHVNNYKAAMGFDYLRAYLGDSLFDSAIQTWCSNSELRHSRPGDLRNFFETHTGRDLSWFFIDFTGTTKRLDYKVLRLRDQQLLIENNAELASPLVIAGMTGDSITFKKWVEGFHGHKWLDIPPGNYTEIKIDPGHVMPELYRLNNTIRTSGILPRFDPVRPRFLFNIDDPGQRTLVYIPLVNWTRENGVMPGVALHSGFPLPKPTEYFFTPFYSVKNSSLAGSGQVLFNIAPYDNLVRLATITLEGTQFGAPANQNYRRAKGGLDLHLRSGNIINPLRQRLYFRYITASDLLEINLSEKAQMSSFMQFGYGLERRGLINPFSLLTSLEIHKYFQKASVELNYRYSYYGENGGMDVRLFAGSMLKNVSGAPFHALSAGGRGGREKYLYGGTYPDRFSPFPDTFFSRQMTLSEGGLVSPVNEILGYSNWLISLSFTSTLPGMAGWIPVRPFANFLLNENGPEMNHNSPFFYEAGLKAGIWDLFEIYFPFVVSENIGSMSGSYKERIRFVLKLDTFDKLDFIGIMD